MAEQRLTFALSDPDESQLGGLVPEIITALAGIPVVAASLTPSKDSVDREENGDPDGT